MKQQRTRHAGKLSAPADCGSGDWMLQKADAIKGFLAKQRGRNQQSSSKTAWLVAWEQLAAEGELSAKQLQAALQPSTMSGSDLQQELSGLSVLHDELGVDTTEQQLQVLGQAQELISLAKRAVYMGHCSDLLPAEAAALASLRQELQWLLQDTQQQQADLAAAAEGLIAELAAAVPGAAGASAGMLDGVCAVRRSSSEATGTGAQPAATTAAGDQAPCSSSSTTCSSRAGCAPTEVGTLHTEGAGPSAACIHADTRTAGATEPLGPVAACLHVDAEPSAAPLQATAAEAEAAGSSMPCHDGKLQQLFLQHPLAPSSLQQQLQAGYTSLQQQQQQQLQEVSAQQRQHVGQCLGSWSGDDHALFVWLRGQAVQAASAPAHTAVRGSGTSSTRGLTAGFRQHAGTATSYSRSSSSSARCGTGGCSTAAVMDYVALRMPGKSKQQVEDHEAWYTTAMQLQRRMEDLQDTWQRQKAAFLQAADASLAGAAASTAAAAVAAADRLSTAVSRQLLHEQLEGIQAIKQQQQEQAEVQQAAAAAVAAAQAAAEAATRQERCARQRELVQTYMQEMAQQLQEAEAQAEQLRVATVQATAEAIAAHKPAVAARQGEALQRRHAQQERQRQPLADAAARQLRLEAIASALGPKLERDPDRVLQATAASAAPAAAVGQAFRPVHGFTAQQVTKDPRFRLVEALREAVALRGGASSVGYLKQAMAQLQGQ